MENLKQKILDYIDSQKDEMISTLSELISYPSVKGEPADGAPFGVPAAKCLKRALQICESFGFTTRNGRANPTRQESRTASSTAGAQSTTRDLPLQSSTL